MLSLLPSVAKRELDSTELCLRRPRAHSGLAATRRAADAGELTDIAEQLGLSVSERPPTGFSARRSSAPARDASWPRQSESPQRQRTPTSTATGAASRSTTPTCRRSRAELEAAFDTIAERYYLHLKCEPHVTVGKDDIRVRFDVEKED